MVSASREVVNRFEDELIGEIERLSRPAADIPVFERGPGRAMVEDRPRTEDHPAGNQDRGVYGGSQSDCRPGGGHEK